MGRTDEPVLIDGNSKQSRTRKTRFVVLLCVKQYKLRFDKLFASYLSCERTKTCCIQRSLIGEALPNSRFRRHVFFWLVDGRTPLPKRTKEPAPTLRYVKGLCPRPLFYGHLLPRETGQTRDQCSDVKPFQQMRRNYMRKRFLIAPLLFRAFCHSSLYFSRACKAHPRAHPGNSRRPVPKILGGHRAKLSIHVQG